VNGDHLDTVESPRAKWPFAAALRLALPVMGAVVAVDQASKWAILERLLDMAPPRVIEVTGVFGQTTPQPNLSWNGGVIQFWRFLGPPEESEKAVAMLERALALKERLGNRSSLALTLPRTPTAEDDGFLTLADVLAGWRGALAGCELVVLSACETQKGYEQRDEGVFALPVGVLYAGAPSVIASLWRVDDASTAELFADFYRRLADGKGKLEAFTEARRELRKKYPEPYHWAPFVYIGDPR